MPPPNSSSKPGRVDEPLAEPPARPPGALCPGPPNPVHWHHFASGHVHEVGYDAAQYLKLLAGQCAYCSSGLDEVWNESDHGCMNMPPTGLKQFGEAP